MATRRAKTRRQDDGARVTRPRTTRPRESPPRKTPAKAPGSLLGAAKSIGAATFGHRGAIVDVEVFARAVRRRIDRLVDRSTRPVRDLRREVSKALETASGSDVLRLSLTLLGAGADAASRLVASELVARHRGARESLDVKSLTALAGELSDWGAVDAFACLLAGPAWREGKVPDSVIAGWARSGSRWWRRAALVATVALNRPALGGTGDVARTLAICRLLVDDRDDMVVKALSWSLRELTKVDPVAVTGFLAETSGRLAARVVREVTTKLQTGRKTASRPRE